MRIVLTDQNYAPEEVSGAILVTELATDLARHGHQVTVVTSNPNYPYGKIFPGYRNRLCSIEWMQGVRVVRIWSYISPQKTFWRRILNYGTFSIMVFWGGLLAGRPDIIMSYSPPLPLGISAWLLSWIWQVPWVLRVEDLYPDAAVAAGLLTNKTAIKFFSALESFLYKRSEHISVISEGFRQNLLSKQVPSDKISITPVWADRDIVRPMPKENAFKAENHLLGKFIVMYAGTVGHTSCLGDVLDAAELLQDEMDLCFVIIGEGVKKSALEQSARQRNLSNVIFLPFQPRARFSEMLAAADVSLVTLNKNSAQTSLPSKIFNIMASARPILAVSPLASEIALLVEQADCGLVISPGVPGLLADALVKMKSDPSRLEVQGQNGRKVLEQNFSRVDCVNQYESMLITAHHTEYK